ncbi:MAG: penicillin-binding protein 2 [Treponemataceae bacterium]|nr:penicillin-binding protein 2 [Treponemataceae bacterium]
MVKVIHATDLQNQAGSTGKKNEKILLLSIIVVVTFILYLVVLFKMQVVEGDGYRIQSTLVAQRTKILPAQRGEIYDRKADYPIVNNIDSFAVDFIPGEAGSKYDSVASRLAQYLGMSKFDIDNKIPASERKQYATYEIKSSVSFDEINNIAENITDLPGVSWRSKPLRNYIENTSLSHVIGYVGDITKDELKVLYNKGYTSTSIVGKTGIESQYDELLQGKTGIEYRTVDVKGRNLSSTPVTKQPPELGKNLVLTIDTGIQHLAEDALGERIGAAVVLKPSTGEVLAMVSYPYFDANLFSTRQSAAELQKLKENPNKPFINRAVNAAYPPASTFKVIMSTALLTEKTFPADQKIECTGIMDYGGRPWRCHIYKKGTHGFLDLKNALAQSCNIYFWTIGRDYLGVDRISEYANNFGYGLPLGIDLPTSTDGFVPTAQWKERRYHQKWMDGDTMNMSIGQSDTLVTPLHVADMMSMIVNEGVIYKPHLLKEIRDPVTNEIIQSIEPEPMYTMDIDENIWKEMKTNLRYMVTDGSATYPLANKVVQIAGKTGTAEVSGYDESWHSWFVGYGPFDGDPEDAVVVVVLVEAANTWEWWAPYASNIIFQGIFANQTYDEAVKALHFTNIAKPVGRQE